MSSGAARKASIRCLLLGAMTLCASSLLANITAISGKIINQFPNGSGGYAGRYIFFGGSEYNIWFNLEDKDATKQDEIEISIFLYSSSKSSKQLILKKKFSNLQALFGSGNNIDVQVAVRWPNKYNFNAESIGYEWTNQATSQTVSGDFLCSNGIGGFSTRYNGGNPDLHDIFQLGLEELNYVQGTLNNQSFATGDQFSADFKVKIKYGTLPANTAKVSAYLLKTSQEQSSYGTADRIGQKSISTLLKDESYDLYNSGKEFGPYTVSGTIPSRPGCGQHHIHMVWKTNPSVKDYAPGSVSGSQVVFAIIPITFLGRTLQLSGSISGAKQYEEVNISAPKAGSTCVILPGSNIDMEVSGSIHLKPGFDAAHSFHGYVNPGLCQQSSLIAPIRDRVRLNARATNSIPWNDINLSLEPERAGISNIQLYPNPVHQSVSIKSVEMIEELSLHDLSGKLIMQEAVYRNELDHSLQGLKAGTYILGLKTAKGWIRQKVSKVD